MGGFEFFPLLCQEDLLKTPPMACFDHYLLTFLVQCSRMLDGPVVFSFLFRTLFFSVSDPFFKVTEAVCQSYFCSMLLPYCNSQNRILARAAPKEQLFSYPPPFFFQSSLSFLFVYCFSRLLFSSLIGPHTVTLEKCVACHKRRQIT